MKRIVLLLVMGALLLASCTKKEANYIVKGTITDSLSTTEGAMLVIKDMITEALDTIMIIDGTFEYSAMASDSTIKRISLITKAGGHNDHFADFIPEKGVITINLDIPIKVSGTPLNDALVRYNAQLDSVYRDNMRQRRELSEQLTQFEKNDALKKLGECLKEQLTAISKEVYLSNLDNAIGLSALQGIVYELKTVAEYDELLNKGAWFIRNYEPFIYMRKFVAAGENTAEGKMFTDFPCTTLNGSQAKLSDYVGKGQYVVLDFWASWCTPCKAEMPNIKEVHETYSKKGLTVISVAVWDGDNSKSKEVIKRLGMNWTQIFVGEDTTSVDAYGITGIPHIILFAPDGTILKRGLRGEMLKATVGSLL